MQEPIASAKTPNRRGRAKFLAGSVALTMATFGGVVAVTAGTAFAYSSVESQAYTISGAAATISGVTASVSPATFPNTGNYTIKFVTPTSITPSSTGTIPSVDLVDADPTAGSYNAIVHAIAPATVGVVDLSTGYTYVATVAVPGLLTGSTLTAAEAAPLIIDLEGSGSINAGDTLDFTFAAANPAVAGSYNFYAATSANGTYEESNAVSLAATSAATVTSSSLGLSTGAEYSVTDVVVPAGTTALGSFTLQSCLNGTLTGGTNCGSAATTDSGTGGVVFSSTPSAYTVTNTTTATALTVSSVSPVNTGLAAASQNYIGGVTVNLSSSTPLIASDTYTITAVGTNPTGGQADTFAVGFGAGSATSGTFPVTNTLASTTVTFTPAIATAYVGDHLVITAFAPGTVTGIVDGTTTVLVNAGGTTGTLSATPGGAAITSLTLTLPAAAASDVATGSVSFGNAPSNVTVALSNSGTGASSNYMVGWTTSSSGAMPIGTLPTEGPEEITITAPTGTDFANSSGVVQGAVLTDTTSGASQVIPAAAGTLGTTATVGVAGMNLGSTDNVVDIIGSLNISDSDAIMVTLFGVTNPGQGSYSGTTGLSVSTTGDPVAADNATAYVVGPTLVSTAAPSVTVSPATPGSLATYTVSGFKAADALVGGTDTIQILGETGTEFPGTATLTDATTSTGTQTISETAGVGTDEATYKLADAVAAGDSLSLTLADVVNPAGGSFNIYLGADNESTNTDAAGTQGLATPEISFAGAASTYPDASIINFSGTDYVFAGGHAFGVPSPTVLAGVQAVDPATALTAATGATVPTTAAATGSVIVVYNNPTIYVVGTDGQLHGFATPAQFLGDGFDPADVITVPNTGGLTVGATAGSLGTAANAVATSANGAIVNSSGTYYVFAGSRAFGIPTPKVLSAILASDTATPLTGTIGTTNTTSAIRSGTLVTLKGAVYAAASGQLQEFKSFAQLAKDGYGGTPSIAVPNAGGLAVVSTYSGS